MGRHDPAVLPVGTLHSLEWFWVSRRIFIYSHHNTFVFFSKTSAPHPMSSLLRLQFGLDPFHIYTSHQLKFLTKFQNFNFCKFLQTCNFDFVLFWLGIWCESLLQVIMGRRGGISERRHSSCSSWHIFTFLLYRPIQPDVMIIPYCLTCPANCSNALACWKGTEYGCVMCVLMAWVNMGGFHYRCWTLFEISLVLTCNHFV